uniref:Uncharacterized protein n=1 Tax=Utricularia reniformis TaxID=192314 RepID=A0A1Y0B1M2_9LAMI|nr:hypothetical protein AEK19_MT1129 [Utricularia reniformis]ART31345.1 hypothetical protein AEK19_MT1129 [Utricularia reniformis]
MYGSTGRDGSRSRKRAIDHIRYQGFLLLESYPRPSLFFSFFGRQDRMRMMGGCSNKAG